MFLPAAAVSAIFPPSALITPVLVTVCLGRSPLTATSISPSPYRSTVAVSPEARCTRPRRAEITPLFSTFGATKPTRPPSLAVMVPSLMMEASGLPARSNTSLSLFMKLLLLMSAVVAINPLMSILLPLPNNTPLALRITTLPLAVSLPKICDAEFPPTRLSAMALLDG